MSEARERIKHICEHWFITEPLLFAVRCTHDFAVNESLSVPFRAGGGRIEYSPVILEELSDSELEEYLKIEVIRIVLKHPYTRLPLGADRQVLTLASNITVADTYPTPLRIAKSSDYGLEKGLCFEEYYQFLLDMFDKKESDGKGDDNENDDADGDKAPGNDDEDETKSQEEKALREVSQLWREDEGFQNDVNALIENAAKSDGWGTLPLSLRMVISASLKPEHNYRRMLSLFRTSVMSSRRCLTRMKPSRRSGFLHMGSRYALTTNILIGIDVSGSVPDKSISHFFSVLNGFFSYGLEKTDVFEFDSELKSTKPVMMKKAVKKFGIAGRGGTNFQPIVDYYCRNKQYDGLIVFTDGSAPVPAADKNRHPNILWVLSGRKEYQRCADGLRRVGKVTYLI